MKTFELKTYKTKAGKTVKSPAYFNTLDQANEAAKFEKYYRIMEYNVIDEQKGLIEFEMNNYYFKNF